MLVQVSPDRFDLSPGRAYGLLQLFLRDAELLGPVAQLIVLIDVDALPVLPVPLLGVVCHWEISICPHGFEPIAVPSVPLVRFKPPQARSPGPARRGPRG